MLAHLPHKVIAVFDRLMLWQWHLSHGTVAFIDGLPPDRRDEFRQRLIASADADGIRTLHAMATLWTARNHAPDETSP